MDFGFWDIVFIVVLTIFFLYRDLKKKFHTKENEIDRVLNAAEQVKYKNMEVIYIRSEIVNDEIYIWDTISNTFLTQGKTFEDAVKEFMKHNPNKRLQIKVNE
jgi:hypothetical protein